MLKTLSVATRDRGRLAEITAIATRFGLGVLLARLGLGSTPDDSQSGADLPRRTRQALEALGPTFVKLGQILATRQDILPADWIAEFSLLHSDAPTLPFADLRPRVEEALGETVENAFAHFDETPLAAASMAQVHCATLHDGREVVVKIRRPGIAQRMRADIRLITHLAALAENGNRDIRRLQPRALIQTLLGQIEDELDFRIEGRNADRLRADLSDNPRVLLPEIHWQFSSEAVLVMDYLSGIPPRSAQALLDNGIDPASIAELGAELVLEMVLVNGRFHGDPHPGNLLCLPGNRLALIDLGLVGHVSARRQQEFLTFILSLRSGDATMLAETLSEWSAGAVPRERLLAVAEHLVARHGDGPLVLGALVADFFPLLRKEGLVLPADLALIFKALITMDGVLSAIRPGFDLTDALQRQRGRLLLNRVSAVQSPERLVALMLELARISDDAPRLLRALTRRLETPPRQDIMHDAPIGAAAKWIAGAILLAGAMMSIAIALH